MTLPDHNTPSMELAEHFRWKSIALNAMIVFGVLIAIYAILNVIPVYKYATFTHPPTGIRIKFPNNWGFDDPKQPGAIIVFTAPPEGPLDMFTENVVLTYWDLNPDINTLPKLSSKMIHQVTRTFKGYMEVLESKKSRVGGRLGHKFVYVGKVEGVDHPNKFMHVWTIIGNRAFIITYMAKESTFNKYLKFVNTMIDSLGPIPEKK
ncbi:MAG TPA: hypothetical protein PLT76_10030 [Candidatus Omnitrophota bacterium]|nr:hypothetical protein [Candidatus Omnitrophota bacterium]